MLNNWELIKIFNLYMGTVKSCLELEDWNRPNIGFSKSGTSHWEVYDKPKNFDYWFSKDRFTYISRQHYKNDYVKGYIWGRYLIKNKLDDNIKEEDAES